jgi:hypothetical protein
MTPHQQYLTARMRQYLSKVCFRTVERRREKNPHDIHIVWWQNEAARDARLAREAMGIET